MAIVINIGHQVDGCTYQLHPKSELQIRKKFPGVRPAPSIFVGYDTQADFEALHGRMWPQIAMMLTGLTPKQMQSMGGVKLYDPVVQREVARVA